MQPIPAQCSNQRGSTLVEVLVALVLFSMGVLGLLRTLTFAVRNSGQAEYRLVAMNVADQRLAQILTDLAHYSAYVELSTGISALPAGTRTVTFDGPVVTITVAWQAPASDPSSYSSSSTLPVSGSVPSP